MRDCDVIIIGGGPTGVFLGNLLGARGIRVVIVEKEAQTYDLPRAVHFDGEVMRLFQSAGLAEAVFATVRVNPGMLFKDPSGKVLVDWSRDTGIGPMGWHESYRCHQPGLERVLRQGLARFPGVTFLGDCNATGLSQDGDHVTVSTDAGAFRARYVVACDGAASPVRHWLGIEMEDLGFRERWLVVDLGLLRDRPDLGDHSIQFCDPKAPATYVRGTGMRRRWEIRMEPGDPDAFDEAEIWSRLQRWITPEEAEIERAATYTFRSRLARRWQAGRVFLAGDAAHQMPPFMGQGMCAGFRDAANLAWKLAAVLDGASEGVLASYESERVPNARAFIELSTDLGRLINRTIEGTAPEGRMHSIWPGLGPGLGPRNRAAGRLVPQVGRADDAAPQGFYVLARVGVELGVPSVVGAEDWLDGQRAFGVIVRPDGYALDQARDAAELEARLAAHADLLAAVPDRLGFA